MTPAFILILMLFGWISVALALLWGMLRIARRHHRPEAPTHAASRLAHPSQTHERRLNAIINL
ncbi:hypothetical protein N8H22_09770 [Stutzerimonas stutzeri]|uniref:hypothetical protein n=1 Tax=Stutzerimonas sp. S1 TaxID=3030652 RepID=UPI00222496A9|nr:hypothetical protein [Stutzerimonas sp. S1]